ncbi:hypothetical protein C8F04DRAFT_227991 [Mycena alexandri]|uniref:Uncharacterized protein n=1 Tax=Mycena alexandri TaxID=1745969 RepID=A0AAD6T6M3_9AGAR|nr:hypothetical protein C8F04DRAFT_227991 [Mycena alexandri]
MPLFSDCNSFSVTAGAINIGNGSIRCIRSPAEVNIYGAARNTSPGDRPPSQPSRTTHGRGAVTSSTDPSVNYPRINDYGSNLEYTNPPARLSTHIDSFRDGRYHAAGRYEESDGAVHSDPHSGQSVNYSGQHESRVHGESFPAYAYVLNNVHLHQIDAPRITMRTHIVAVQYRKIIPLMGAATTEAQSITKCSLTIILGIITIQTT